MTLTIFMELLQWPQTSILSYLFQMEFHAQVRILSTSAFLSQLYKNVKQVMEAIVGLLKDRVDIEKELMMKRQRFKSILKRNN